MSTVATVTITVVCVPQGWIWQGGIVLAAVMFGGSVDGMLARVTTGGTHLGAFLDSTLDRLGDGAIFGSLTAYIVFRMDDSFARMWATVTSICPIVDAAAVPYARARAESVGVVAKLGIAEHTDRLIIDMGTAIPMSLGLSGQVFAAGLIQVAFAPFVTVCQRIWFTIHNTDEGTS